MKKITFECFKDFSCLLGKCQNNCCIGWEINVDKKTFKKYQKNKTFSSHFIDKIDCKERKFIKKDDRSCAFLNDDNLCEIIINFGKEYLCEVCSIHPRFRNCFSDRVEEGIGLCCEKACELLFDKNNSLCEVEEKTNGLARKNNSFENEILTFRKKLINIIFAKDKVFLEKIDEILNIIDVKRERFYNFNINSLYCSLEKLNTKLYDWIKNIYNYCEFNLNDDNESLCFERLVWYFFVRHLPTAIDFYDLRSKTLFSLLSAFIVFNIYKEKRTKNFFLEVVREYSEEIEYSQENLDKIFDACDNLLIYIK